MRSLAVIPARGGSKRIPRKNVRAFCGKPMIAWSIEAARRSGLFDRILVSTDDGEIARIAVECGAEVPFTRPAELADDHTGTTAVVAHAVRWLSDHGWPAEAVCCIYPTAPFIDPADLRNAWQLMNSADWAYVFAATEFAAPIFRSFRCNEDGGIRMFCPEHFASRSQDLPMALHDAGQFYWGRARAWVDHTRVFSERSTCIRVPRWRVQDIDCEEDWLRAESMAAYLGLNQSASVTNSTGNKP